MKRKIGIFLAVLVAVLAGVWFWQAPPRFADVSAIQDREKTPGSVISVTRVGGHSQIVLSGLLSATGLPVKTNVSDGIAMFRVKYWSQLNGAPVEASGLMTLPYSVLRGKAPRGTVMYFHGTNPDRTGSPSAPSQEEGLLPSGIFAGGGYVLLAPDYIGLGQSRAPQTYLVVEPTVSAARDLLVASQRISRAMNVKFASNTYLSGFSQGGHATAIVQRSLEANPLAGVEVKGAAAIAGAFDLARISILYAFKHKHRLYLGYVAHSYALQYRQSLDSLLTPKYAALVPTLFDGDQTSEAIDAALPQDPREMFLPERLAEIETGTSNWFVDGMKANEAANWAPKAPLRLYYGDNDTDVSPEDSKNFFAVSSKMGGNLKLMPVGPYGHSESAYHAVPLSRLWFDELTGQAQGQ
jgi:pimeloyl-ACP methyl ester carboxylesterase